MIFFTYKEQVYVKYDSREKGKSACVVDKKHTYEVRAGEFHVWPRLHESSVTSMESHLSLHSLGRTSRKNDRKNDVLLSDASPFSAQVSTSTPPATCDTLQSFVERQSEVRHCSEAEPSNISSQPAKPEQTRAYVKPCAYVIEMES